MGEYIFFYCEDGGSDRKIHTYKETQEILDCFSKGILFRTHEENTITPLAVEVAKELFLDGYYKAIAFGDGNCQKCAKCNPECCNFPGQIELQMACEFIDLFVFPLYSERNNPSNASTVPTPDITVTKVSSLLC